VHGHTHRPGRSTLAPGFERQVLSDWDVDDAQPRAEVLRLRRDGIVRLSLDAARRA
jgi:UDP-2,3-diacylglucosamine hydrolase